MTDALYSASDVEKNVSVFLRQRGYRKNKLTWIKSKEDLSVVFNIQRSQWANDTWYYNFGIVLHKFCAGKITSISQSHIQTRVQSGSECKSMTLKKIENMIECWEREYGTIEELCKKAKQHLIPNESLACDNFEAIIYLLHQLDDIIVQETDYITVFDNIRIDALY